MDFLLPLKASKYALGAVGATGTLGTAVSGKYVYENFRPLSAKQFMAKVDNSYLTSSGLSSGEFKLGNCFSEFFPSVEMNMEVEQIALTTESEEGSHPETKLSNSNDGSNYSGCAHMKLEPFKGSQRSFYFSSEVVVKNDKVGLALGTVLSTNNVREIGSTIFNYRLVLLEQSDNNWKVKAGYAWVDGVLSSLQSTARGGQHGFKYYIKFSTETWLNGRDANSSESVRSKEWKGKGTYGNESSGKEIFKDIEVYVSDNNSHHLEVLGADNPFEEESSPPVGYSTVQTVYCVDSKKGKEFVVPPKDAKEELKSWYAPFKNKKGTWTKENLTT